MTKQCSYLRTWLEHFSKVSLPQSSTESGGHASYARQGERKTDNHQGIAKDVEEIHHNIKPPKIQVLLKDSENQDSKSAVFLSHQRVLKVTLKSGETWMLDMVGAPEKKGRIIECWKSYMQDNISSIMYHSTPIREKVTTFSVYSERQVPLMDVWRWSVWRAFDLQFGKISSSLELSTLKKPRDLLKGTREKYQREVHEVVKIVDAIVTAALTRFYGSKELCRDMPRGLLRNMFKQSGTTIEELDGLYPSPNFLEQYVLDILREAE
jgi:hypothetical protein